MTFLAGIGAWFAAKSIPWKWIGVLFAVLALLASIGGVVFYVSSTRDQLVESQRQLAVEKMNANLANERAKSIQDQHDKQVVRMQSLDDTRKDLSEEVNSLRSEIADMDLEEDIESDTPDVAATRLNDRHSALNRMLESASRNTRDAAPGVGSKAGAPGRP